MATATPMQGATELILVGSLTTNSLTSTSTPTPIRMDFSLPLQISGGITKSDIRLNIEKEMMKVRVALGKDSATGASWARVYNVSLAKFGTGRIWSVVGYNVTSTPPPPSAPSGSVSSIPLRAVSSSVPPPSPASSLSSDLLRALPSTLPGMSPVPPSVPLAAPLQKRGRGRPRKNPVASEVVASATTTLKRGRGRPRKTPLPLSPELPRSEGSGVIPTERGHKRLRDATLVPNPRRGFEIGGEISDESSLETSEERGEREPPTKRLRIEEVVLPFIKKVLQVGEGGTVISKTSNEKCLVRSYHHHYSPVLGTVDPMMFEYLKKPENANGKEHFLAAIAKYHGESAMNKLKELIAGNSMV